MGLRPPPGWRTWAARAGLGVVAALWCAGAAGAVVEEAKPDGDATLTLEEYLWCRFERLRLEGERSELDSTQGWEVARYNAAHDLRNALCAGKLHEVRDRTFVDEALTPEYQEALRRQGAGRLMVARTEREGRRAYVKSASGTVRAGPSGEAASVGPVAQWGDVFPTGETQGGWTQVEWGLVRSGAEPDHAWVLSALLAPGVGAEARFDHCEAIAGERGAHNEVVRGKASLDGGATFEFHNGYDEDAYVKLVREHDDLVIAFLVSRSDVAEVEKIPAGSYQVLYGTGYNFSRGCESFSERGFARRFVAPYGFGRGDKWTIWVGSTGEEREKGGKPKAELIDYALFEIR